MLLALHTRRAGTCCTSPRRRGFTAEVVPCAGIILARLQVNQWSACLQPGLSTQMFRFLCSRRNLICLSDCYGGKQRCVLKTLCIFLGCSVLFRDLCVCVCSVLMAVPKREVGGKRSWRTDLNCVAWEFKITCHQYCKIAPFQIFIFMSLRMWWVFILGYLYAVKAHKGFFFPLSFVWQMLCSWRLLLFLLCLKPVHSLTLSKAMLFISVLALLEMLCSHKCFVTELHSSGVNSECWQF